MGMKKMCMTCEAAAAGRNAIQMKHMKCPVLGRLIYESALEKSNSTDITDWWDGWDIQQPDAQYVRERLSIEFTQLVLHCS